MNKKIKKFREELDNDDVFIYSILIVGTICGALGYVTFANMRGYKMVKPVCYVDGELFVRTPRGHTYVGHNHNSK